MYDIPEVSRSSKGKAIANLVHMAEGEKIAALLRVQEFPEEEGRRFIVMGTRKGTIKKTDLGAFSNPRSVKRPRATAVPLRLSARGSAYEM